MIHIELPPDREISKKEKEAIEEVHDAIKGIELKKGDKVQIE